MRRRGWLPVPGVALVGTLALAGTIVAQTQVSSDEFLDRLHAARELAHLDGDAPSPERMADLRGALGLPVEVGIGDWVVMLQPDSVLEGFSGRSATDFDLAGDRLATLERSLTDAVAHEPTSPDRVATALAEAYRGVAPPRPDVLAAVLRTIGEVIEAIAQRVGDAVATAGNALAWIALIGLGVIAAILLLRARLVPDRVADAGRAARGGRSVDWAARADEALRAGDLHEAVRALYLALLAVLAGRGIVADAPALTAGEARYAVQRRRPALFPAIARATDSYERVVYGGATPDQRDVEHLREANAQARRP